MGLAEMQTAVEQTGGLLVQASTFHAQAFKESFRRIFAPASQEGHLGMNSNAQFEVCLIIPVLIFRWFAWKAVLDWLTKESHVRVQSEATEGLSALNFVTLTL